MREAEPQDLGEATHEQEPQTLYDVAVVLSCGFKPDKPGDLDLNSKLRILASGILADAGSVSKLIITGGPLQEGSPPISEAMRKYLLKKFPDLKDFEITTETEAMDTEENAKNTAGILRHEGQRSAILITNNFHLKRSFDAFERAGVATSAISAEDIAQDRSEHHRILVARYLKSWQNKKNTAIDIVLRGIAKTASGR